MLKHLAIKTAAVSVVLLVLGLWPSLPIANAQSATPPDELGPGQSLVPGMPLMSPNSQYKLYLQGDGNVVLYGPGTKPI